MRKTKNNSTVSHEDRQCAADKFVNGDRIRHLKTGRSGLLLGQCEGLAIPSFWVTWDEDETRLKATEQADPLDLELIQLDAKARQIFEELLEEQSESEEIATFDPVDPELMAPETQDDEMIDKSFPRLSSGGERAAVNTDNLGDSQITRNTAALSPPVANCDPSALVQTAAGVATPSIDSPRSNMNNFSSSATTVGRSVVEPEETDSTVETTPDLTSDPLTDDEIADRHRLELRVERAFYEAGSSLRELRNRRLYRSSHKTFEDYCQDRFGYTRSYCNFLIKAADSYENLKMATNCCQKLPTKENQVRPLVSLEPDEQCQAWEEAVDQAGNQIPSGRIVKQVVMRRKGIVEDLKDKIATPCSDTYQPGQVFEISAKSGWLKKYDGCWAIAKAVNNFSLEVEIYSEVLTQVKPENLTPIDSPQECREIAAIASRVCRLRECGLLEPLAYTVLEYLGKKTYLSDLEEEYLALLEKRYNLL